MCRNSFSKYAVVVPLKDKNAIKLLSLFRKFLMSLGANQANYGWIKVANFTVDQ